MKDDKLLLQVFRENDKNVVLHERMMRIEWETIRVANLPTDFDEIYCEDWLQYYRKSPSYLVKGLHLLFSHLRKGGHMIVAVPDPVILLDFYHSRLKPWREVEARLYPDDMSKFFGMYSAEELSILLEKVGFHSIVPIDVETDVRLTSHEKGQMAFDCVK